MTKIFEQWVPAPFPGKVYLEIEGDTVKYGFAPAGIELSLFERPLVRSSKGTMDIWVKGDKKAGVMIGLRKISGHCAQVKLFIFVAHHRKRIWQDDRVCWQ